MTNANLKSRIEGWMQLSAFVRPSQSDAVSTATTRLAIWQAYSDAREAGEASAADLATASALVKQSDAASIRAAATDLWRVSPDLQEVYPEADMYWGWVIGSISGRLRILHGPGGRNR